MISKIKIQNVASYKSAAILETDKKVNVVYGLNGSGKSTLSNFLYQPDSTGCKDCSLEMANDTALYVYNQRFIEENFFEADNIKGIFSLSKENKDIKLKLEEVQDELNKQGSLLEDAQKGAKAEQLRLSQKRADACNATWKIKTKYTGGDRVLEKFLDGLKGTKEVLFSHLIALDKPQEEPEKDIAAIKKDVEDISGDSAHKYAELPLIKFDAHDVEADPLFEQVVVGNTSSAVAELIKYLQNSDWVQKGLSYTKTPLGNETGICPFCQQDTISKEVLDQIKSYFDKSYDDSVRQIATLSSRYFTVAGKLPSLEIAKSNHFVVRELVPLTEKYRNLEKSIEENCAKIQAKIASPSRSFKLKCSRNDVAEFNEILKVINGRIAKHNERIENVDKELASLKNQFWVRMRWEYDQTISTWVSEQVASKSVLSGFSENEKIMLGIIDKKKIEITNLQKSTVNVDEAIGNINEGLVQIGISDFSIAKHDDSLYKIIRVGNSTADFSSLSEGEKMIISFLYFCELCKGKRNVAEITGKKVAVIDDPISSLSHIFVFNIGQLLKNDFFNSKVFDQVFVLTHSLYFFYELADANRHRRKENQQLFRLLKNNMGSQILKMKYEEVQNDYHSYWSIVADSAQPPALVANCMRNIVEYFFNFVQKQDLNNVFQKAELKEIRFQAFCRYINRESHSLGQNIFDHKEFDYDSFRDGLRLLFEVTGYSEHYKKMMSVLKHE